MTVKLRDYDAVDLKVGNVPGKPDRVRRAIMTAFRTRLS